jgi:hypothetical protein
VINIFSKRLSMQGLDVDLLRSYLDIDPYKIPPERVESFIDSTPNDLSDTDSEDDRRVDYYRG